MDERAFASRAEWEGWLEAEHADCDGVWVRFPKKGTGLPTVDFVEAIEVALCFGWIDGQRKGLDDTHYLQKFTPRRARSKWSQINVGRCGELIEAGRMRPAGQAQIDAAKADGRWDAAYAPASKIEVPPDLVEAMEAAGVTDVFAGLKSQDRYSILFQLHDAKRPETRARRIVKFTEQLSAPRRHGRSGTRRSPTRRASCRHTIGTGAGGLIACRRSMVRARDAPMRLSASSRWRSCGVAAATCRSASWSPEIASPPQHAGRRRDAAGESARRPPRCGRRASRARTPRAPGRRLRGDDGADRFDDAFGSQAGDAARGGRGSTGRRDGRVRGSGGALAVPRRDDGARRRREAGRDARRAARARVGEHPGDPRGGGDDRRPHRARHELSADVSYAEENTAARLAALGGRRIPTTAIVVGTLDERWLIELEAIAAA